MNETTQAFETIETATRPTDLFGTAVDAGARTEARREYHRLIALVHPDVVNRRDCGRATVVIGKLIRLYRQWEETGATSGTTLVGDRHLYTFGGTGIVGSVADVYRGSSDDGEGVVVKIPRKPSSNALMDAERDALIDIQASGGDGNDWLRHYFPRFVDRIGHQDPTTRERRSINVLNDIGTSFVTLADVRAAYPDGLDPRDYAWMHRRLLRALAAAHRAGWAHTALTADNVLIEPERHGVVVAGWSYATRIGDVPPLAALAERPPEAASMQPVTAGWDVYMAHGLMLDTLRSQTPKRLRSFADGCRQKNPQHRPDAVDLLSEFDDLLENLYGRRRFRQFAMPASAG
ncbi:hypothetical protein HH308_03835 [Gordonia sp. TBRC 11910]|uniref:Protein kinase domain-containing protein n=1 Tax=Gordonia asplenii TaxID=2725283 RepID=A0A848KQ31_9ACTN|nr:hypothetical protein [Gordonia asplenii]NMO00342.1 hypothetical protein [Gordonia asplenii]